MGARHPTLPSPAMIPRNWNIVIIDLKDCFFTILFHPAVTPWVAFLVPKISKTEPMDWYHWTVLPQGMKSSPTICQTYIAGALCSVCKQFPHIYIIIIWMTYCSPVWQTTQEVLPVLRQELQKWGLQIVQEKDQIFRLEDTAAKYSTPEFSHYNGKSHAQWCPETYRQYKLDKNTMWNWQPYPSTPVRVVKREHWY